MADVTMPQLGESVTEGTVLKWLKAPGERVELDDALCEIETEKVTAELPSPYEGTMGVISVEEGATVPVGTLLCQVEEHALADGAKVEPRRGTNGQEASGWSGGPMAIPADERSAQPVAASSATTPPAAFVTAPQDGEPTEAARRMRPDNRQRFYSPAVLRLAGEHNVDLAAIQGSGVDGRVTRKDVDAYLAAGPTKPAVSPGAQEERTAASGAGFDVVALSATRRTIAEHLKRSNLEAPQAWTMIEADVTALVRRREAEKAPFLAREGIELTLLPSFAVAVCETLGEFPALNARWEGDELRRYHGIRLGVAVAAEQGLVVPVVPQAGDLNLAGMARAIHEIVQRARTRKLRLEDIEGGTFTVNNTGAFGSVASKPIVNWPEVGIVTMERAVKRAIVVEGDAIAVRWMMNVCLSFDHRALDGLEAGGFLGALKRRLEV